MTRGRRKSRETPLDIGGVENGTDQVHDGDSVYKPDPAPMRSVTIVAPVGRAKVTSPMRTVVNLSGGAIHILIAGHGEVRIPHGGSFTARENTLPMAKVKKMVDSGFVRLV